MGTYIEEFRTRSSESPLDIGLSERLCPFLFYNLVPYLFVLDRGGWFDWVVRKCLTFRRKPRQDDVKRKSVNRLYPNEVLVRCPNPDALVTAAVGPWDKKAIKVRILFSDERCPNCHHPSEEFIFNAQELSSQLLRFNSFFFDHLLSVFCNKALDRKTSLLGCDDGMKIETAHVIYPCRYHCKHSQFNPPFLPGGFCLHLFQALYPFLLGKMYHARLERDITVTCPAGGCLVTARLERIRRIKNIVTARALDFLRKCFAFLFYPVDIIDYDLNVRVERIQNKHPGCKLQEGKHYTVNMHSKEYVCPASLHVLYPYLLLANIGHTLSWLKDSKGLVACPDCIGILYRLHER